MFNTMETDRLKLQEKLDSGKSKLERNKLGQYATPSMLALDMLTFAKTLIPGNTKVKFLDPGFNTGVFFSALLEVFKKDEIITSKGYEIDPYYGMAAKEFWRNYNIDIQIEDFTKVETIEKFNLIIANPPYVRHHHLSSAQKDFLYKRALQYTNISMSKLCGLYCYFILLADSWMEEGGTAGWLVPTEFMDVNYGGKLREYLLNNVTLQRVHRFNSNDVQFSDALVSSAIIWFNKSFPSREHEIVFSQGGTLTKPENLEKIKLSDLSSVKKWNTINIITSEPKDQLYLSDLFSVKRGIATGANEFFILDKTAIDKYQIPSEFLIPVLPSPRYSQQNEIQAGEDKLPLINNVQFVFSSNEPEDVLKVKYPVVYEYISRGKAVGINEHYLCKNRNIWYQQESRSPAPLLCTYMGRMEKKNPVRFILNHSNAIVTNSYLMLYPKRWLQQRLQDEPELLREIWRQLNSMSSDVFKKEGRVYGGGLQKMEPKELGNIPLDFLKHLLYCEELKLVAG